jgi:hypothetical protein
MEPNRTREQGNKGTKGTEEPRTKRKNKEQTTTEQRGMENQEQRTKRKNKEQTTTEQRGTEELRTKNRWFAGRTKGTENQAEPRTK